VATGSVIKVTPAAGTQLRRGQSLTVEVSRGPAPFQVPDVTGASQGDATSTLQGDGLKVAVSKENSDTIDSGQVISQEPASGQVTRGDTVRLTVSKGPQLVRVPDVSRESIRRATRELEARGFKVTVDSFFQVLGTVVQTKPGAGAMAPKGSTIEVIAV